MNDYWVNKSIMITENYNPNGNLISKETSEGTHFSAGETLCYSFLNRIDNYDQNGNLLNYKIEEQVYAAEILQTTTEFYRSNGIKYQTETKTQNICSTTFSKLTEFFNESGQKISEITEEIDGLTGKKINKVKQGTQETKIEQTNNQLKYSNSDEFKLCKFQKIAISGLLM